MDDTDCGILEGGGAAPGDPSAPRCDDGSGDTAGPPEFDSDAVLAGGGCEHVGGAPLLTIVVVWLLRAILALAVPGTAAAIDAQPVDPDDGGAWLGVAGGERAPGTARIGLFFDHARDPVTIRTGGSRVPVIAAVTTASLGASWDFGVVRVGFAVPEHLFVRGPAGNAPFVHGDRALWVAVPLGSGLSWNVRLERSAGGVEALLGDPGSIVGGLSGDERVGSFEAAFAARLRLQQAVEIAGVTWGKRLEAEGALGHAIMEGLSAGAVVRLSAPWKAPLTRSTLPIEVDGAVRWAATDRVTVHGLVGAGVGRGIGAPSLRLAAGVELHTRPIGDRDHDGRRDPIDACPDAPEDVDGFHDVNGCPDPDDDRDGFLDVVDACPRHAEVVNSWRDDDGCPDELARLVLIVDGDLDRWSVATAGEEPVELLGDEAFTTTALPGLVALDVSSQGYQPRHVWFELEEGLNEEFVALAVEAAAVEVPAVDVPIDARVVEPAVMFAADSSLPDDASLDALAAWLRAHPEVAVVRVEGHADTIAGSRYNLDLSDRRAQTVVDGLVARGISEARLRPVGAGEAAVGAPVRRAVEVYVLVWDDPAPPPEPP